MFRLRWVFLSILGLTGFTARGQEALFLTPNQFQSVGKSCELQLSSTGVAGPALTTWRKFPVRWLFVKTGEVQENRDSADEWLDVAGRLVAPIQGKGPVMVGIDFQPVIEELDASALEPFMTRSTGLAASEKCLVRHIRSAITLLSTVGSKLDEAHSGVATTETSLSSSIHPLMDPTQFKIGSDMAMELVIGGTEAEKATVHILNLNTKKTWTIKTHEEGAAQFRPDAAGIYEIKFQYCKRISGDPLVQFEFYSTTLTFEIPNSNEASK